MAAMSREEFVTLAHNAQEQPWGLARRVTEFGKSMWTWAKSGFAIAPAEVIADRKRICERCPHWTGEWSGKICKICGCSGLKIDLPHSVCPDKPPRWRETIDAWQIKQWAVGVTTAPGRVDATTGRPDYGRTLIDFMASLKRAGWNEVVIFAEPDAIVPPRAIRDLPDFAVVQHAEKLGAWPNRREGIKRLLAEFPDADGILMFEDDAQLVPGCRSWLSAVGWPSEQCGLLSLYRPAGRYRGKARLWQPTDELCEPEGPPGFQKVIHDKSRADGQVWGSVAVAFPRSAAELLAADTCTDTEMQRSTNYADVRLRRWVRRAGLEHWLCKPSLVQHRQNVTSAARPGRTTQGADMRA